MSVSKVRLRIPLKYVRADTAFGHIRGEGEESHPRNPAAVHIAEPPGTFITIVLFVTLTAKPVVVSDMEITGVIGTSRIAIVSLIASGWNSYTAPGIFAWSNVELNRLTEKLTWVSDNEYGHSPVD